MKEDSKTLKGCRIFDLICSSVYTRKARSWLSEVSCAWSFAIPNSAISLAGYTASYYWLANKKHVRAVNLSMPVRV